MDVLVAGAGPVGLAAANVLADAGVAVTVLESEPRLPENLRASTFQPPTLDMLAKLGAARRLIEMGRVAPKVQYRDRAGWLAEFDFGAIAGETAHPFRVQCEQYKLNQVLAARLMHFPHARLEYSSEVTAVEQDERSVTVTAGARKVKGAWLIGADGGRSRVREALGIALGGFTWPERFLVASTPFDFAEKLAAVIKEGKPVAELARYERQRRPIALEYVNTITIANKRNLETRDPQEQRRWRDEMTRTASDSRLAREYLLKISMLASLRKAAAAE